MQCDPNEIFPGRILVIAPHMDDCVLACGSTIHQSDGKARIHVVYATDGMKSPSPIVPWRDRITADLGDVRRSEARAALGSLGIPPENVHFLDLPEARLKRHYDRLAEALNALVLLLDPQHIFMPFRYDRHPDHLAVNRVITSGYRAGLYRPEIAEYFIYYRWRLLSGGDVRKRIDPKYMLEVPVRDTYEAKLAALGLFKSQTTRYYEWQTRPILTPVLLDEVSGTPEYFMRFDPAVNGARVFTGRVFWIRIVHKLEPFLQKVKYFGGAFLLRVFRPGGGAA